MAVGTVVGKAVGLGFKVGLPAFGAYSTFKSGKEKGENVLWTATKFAGESAMFALAPGVGMAYLGSMLVGGGVAGAMAYGQGTGRQNASNMQSVYRREFGGNFIDTENAATMRQRGLEAISHSGNNLNQVFGNEARTFYRGMR